jgi:MoxR-like ATPase
MEHDGRRIPLHKYNRIFATANTKGRGSDDGMYAGDNEMSEATRDRFSLWLEMDYQDIDDDIIVLKAKTDGIDTRTAQIIAKLAHSIRNGFKQSSLSQTCSMRQQLETADKAVHLIKTMKARTAEEKMACLRRAIDRVILGRANEQDQNSIEGYMTVIEPKLTVGPATTPVPGAAAPPRSRSVTRRPQ